MEIERTIIVKTISRKTEVGGINLPDFKAYYRAMEIDGRKDIWINPVSWSSMDVCWSDDNLGES